MSQNKVDIILYMLEFPDKSHILTLGTHSENPVPKKKAKTGPT